MLVERLARAIDAASNPLATRMIPRFFERSLRASQWSVFTFTFVTIAALLLVPAARAGVLTYVVELPRDAVTVVNSSGFYRVLVDAKGYRPLADVGKPALPYRMVNFILPQGESVASYAATPGPEVALGAFESPLLARPFATPDGVVGKDAPLFDAAAQTSAYPPAAAIYLGTGYLHGYAIASFAVFPLRASEGTLYLAETVSLRVTTAGAPAPPAVAVRKRRSASSDAREAGLVSALVVNPDLRGEYSLGRIEVKRPEGGFSPSSYPSLEGSSVDYLIITNDALAAEYQRLADWKTARGMPTVVRTTEWIAEHCRNGVDLAETIRFFIRDAYEKWGVQFVLLGGDTDVIPARNGASVYLGYLEEVAADLYFACLDGSWNDDHDRYWGESGLSIDNPDLYAEVNLGRLPTSTVADAAILVDKVIAYETPAQPDYLDKICLEAEVLFPPDWHPGDAINYNGADISELLYDAAFDGKPLRIAKQYESYMYYPGSLPLTRDAVLDSMDAGVNIVNHIGHGSRFNFSCGDASVLQSDVDALTNGDRLFLLYLIDCSVSMFDYQCISENFLTNPNGGAVATVGASDLEFPAADSYYMYEFYDVAFNDGIVRLGEMVTRCRLPRTPWAQMGDGVDLWTHYVTTLLGDPEMPLYTGAVSTASVAHVASVGLGTTSILVNVTSGGQPVDSAHVCLSKGTEDYEVGATNALGNVVLEFTSETAGAITVVVTGRNLARHEGTITVTGASGAYVSYASHTVDDDASGGSFGNSNGAIDAGETIDMVMSVKNTGLLPAADVSLVLRCSNPMVTVVDSTAAVGPVGTGSTAAATDPVRVQFDGDIADETAVEFWLVIKNGGVVTWNDRFKREVHAPDLELTTLRINDGAPLGNGNGVIEAGEQFRLYYGLKNYGTGLSSGLTATISDLDEMFVFFDSTDAYADLGSFVEGENVDGFHVAELEVTLQHDIEVAITDLFSRVYRDTIELRVPLPPTGLVFDSSLGPDRLEVSWTKSVSADVARYMIYHATVSGGPYTQVNVDPIDHAVYLDSGLSPSTPYYYVVTAVDRSGNESARSAEGFASTNPPQMAGFPIHMEVQTTSSPAVGDINGDGDLEIVVGNKWIYAFHHDGLEVKDGDSDPQSWGVLTTVGDTYTAPVALARIDSQPGLDIIAADLYTKKVYCVDYNGNAIAGWPRQAENDFRASPAAADLDGDGLYEVVAVDSKGVIYVWRANGTEWLDGDSNPATDGVFYRTPPVTFHFQAPTICDIDEDDMDEIVVGTSTDSVWVFNGDRSRVPGFPIKLNNDLAGNICAGDVDKDGRLELLAQTKGLVGKAYLINHDGTIATGWPKDAKIKDIFFTPSPALADFNGDGYLESVLYAWDGVSARIYVYQYGGWNYPGWPKVISTHYTDTSSLTVADVNGDGSPDIVLGDESRFIYAWSITGNMIPGFPVQAEDAVRATPFLTDLDRDGDIDMVVHSWDQNIYAFDLSGAYDRNLAPWPTYQANAHRNGQIGFFVTTAIGDDEQPAVDLTHARLFQNYPNPFNPTTRIDFVVPEGRAQHVSLTVYDVTGARVLTLVDATKTPGGYHAVWEGRGANGNPVSSGVYFYRLTVGSDVMTKKMVLLK